MRRITSALFIATVLGLGAPALADTANETATPSSVDASAPKKERLVCVRERELGSNLSKKVCQTEAQWRAEREHSQESRKKPNN